MLFLGAGASAAFGVPTRQELTKEAESLLVEKGFETSLLEEMKQALAKYDLNLDFESLLTILQAFSRPKEAIRDSGPLAAYLASKMQSPMPTMKEADDYISRLKALLVEKCAGADVNNAASAYRRLFETLTETQRVRTSNSQNAPFMGGVMMGPQHIRTQDIFTLNYDVVIENVFNILGIDNTLLNGFESVGMRWLWRPGSNQAYRFGQHGVTNLVKLHGSIDQFVRRDGEIEKRQAPPQLGYYTTDILEEMMIFPVHEKHVTRSPYIDLYNLFRRSVQTDPLCVVIGYSFRDEAVNNAFIDAVNTNRNLKLIYVGGQKAESNIERVPQIKNRTQCQTWRFDYASASITQIGTLRNSIESWYPQ